jgi:hypothetical protein
MKKMEVREIIETTVKEPIIEIKFRLVTDSDEVMRSVEFQLDEIEEYGYNILTEDFDLFDIDDDWENDEFDYLDDDDNELNIDEEELISFMNEYFLINNRVPPAELF